MHSFTENEYILINTFSNSKQSISPETVVILIFIIDKEKTS